MGDVCRFIANRGGWGVVPESGAWGLGVQSRDRLSRQDKDYYKPAGVVVIQLRSGMGRALGLALFCSEQNSRPPYTHTKTGLTIRNELYYYLCRRKKIIVDTFVY